MAGYKHNVRTPGPQTETVHVRFTGDADVDANGFTVNAASTGTASITAAKTAEGLIDVTLNQGYPTLLCVHATISEGVDDIKVHSDPGNSSVTTGVIALQTTVGGVDTDADNCEISLTVVVQNRTAQ